MKPYTILCPTDFSECSLNAIEYAAKLGEKYEAHLIIFHVPNKEDYNKLNLPNKPGEELQFSQNKLNNLVKTVREESLSKGLTSCEGLINEGKTIEAIMDCAAVNKVDLIVMGTEGVNEFKKNYIGTTTSKIVSRSAQDVFVIPRKVFFKMPRKLVYATDYLEEDKLAIQKVVDIAKFFDSEIDIVHVGVKLGVTDKALHQSMIEEITPFINYEKINFVLKAYQDDPGLGLESYLVSAKGDILFTLSMKKSWFDQLFTQNLSRKMSYFINKPLYVIKTL
ncbi:universal stress protein [Lunatibacter salilacus]|uniref:universal stress protein n=1 Tax=Lunatibacter salilacus TaxID=2483804 RepID=UPI00131D4416|nr:universal stress protein [Lunatibacter salilacus]